MLLHYTLSPLSVAHLFGSVYFYCSNTSISSSDFYSSFDDVILINLHNVVYIISNSTFEKVSQLASLLLLLFVHVVGGSIYMTAGCHYLEWLMVSILRNLQPLFESFQ